MDKPTDYSLPASFETTDTTTSFFTNTSNDQILANANPPKKKRKMIRRKTNLKKYLSTITTLKPTVYHQLQHFNHRYRHIQLPTYLPQKLQLRFLPANINFSSTYTPLCHQFKSRSNSSVRVDIAKHILLHECHLNATGNVSYRTAMYQDNKIRKLKYFQHLLLPSIGTFDSTKKQFTLRKQMIRTF
jgi:hypothetical protein